jgi:hypothetical protein
MSNTSLLAMEAYKGANSHLWDSYRIDFSAFVQPHDFEPGVLYNPLKRPVADDYKGFDNRTEDSAPTSGCSPPMTTSITLAPSDIGGKHSRDIGIKRKQNPKKTSTADNKIRGSSTSREKGRKKHQTTFKKSEEDISSSDETRQLFLERNRLAADKCRRKKKAWTAELEEQARLLKTQRYIVINQVNQLRYELLELKYRCLQHIDCECEQIRQYLGNMVQQHQPLESASDQLSNPRMRKLTTDSVSALSPAFDLNSGLPNLDSAEKGLLSLGGETQLDFVKVDLTKVDLAKVDLAKLDCVVSATPSAPDYP